MSGDTVFSQRVEGRLRRFALADERTPFQTVIRVMPLLLDVVDAGQALEDAENAADIEAAADAMDALAEALASLAVPVLDEAVEA